MSTIFAVSSGAPPAAIAVLRLSGPAAMRAAALLAGSLPAPRRAAVRRLRDPRSGVPLDDALLLVFPGPASATGEDLVELHLHGGRAVVRAVSDALYAVEGVRPAEPGEFARRALENGRIDLTAAEGLSDLLSAETELQRRAALRSAEGGVRRHADEWTRHVLALAAQVEAVLDHDDEDDVAVDPGLVAAAAAALADEIEAAIARPPVERLLDGLRIVLAGPPNAGKSTLLNALAERDAAITSDIAGTTRDRLEVPVQRDGFAYIFIDTAGLTDTPGDRIEAIGVDRAQEALATADLILWLGDTPPVDPERSLWLYPQADVEGRGVAPLGRMALSARTGAGLDALWRAIGARAATLVPPRDEVAFNQRQRALFAEAARALRAATEESDWLLVAERFRAALRAFDRVTGRANVEAMLDTLFARFCIGK